MHFAESVISGAYAKKVVLIKRWYHRTVTDALLSTTEALRNEKDRGDILETAQMALLDMTARRNEVQMTSACALLTRVLLENLSDVIPMRWCFQSWLSRMAHAAEGSRRATERLCQRLVQESDRRTADLNASLMREEENRNCDQLRHLVFRVRDTELRREQRLFRSLARVIQKSLYETGIARAHRQAASLEEALERKQIELERLWRRKAVRTFYHMMHWQERLLVARAVAAMRMSSHYFILTQIQQQSLLNYRHAQIRYGLRSSEKVLRQILTLTLTLTLTLIGRS